jgi:hypothetical protein
MRESLPRYPVWILKQKRKFLITGKRGKEEATGWAENPANNQLLMQQYSQLRKIKSISARQRCFFIIIRLL